VFVQTADAPGQVQVLSAGRVFAEAGLMPSEALEPMPAPVALDNTPPVQIKIPDLGIDASIVHMDMGADNILPVPTSGQDVAWYSYGARLGEEGNAILAGHIDWNRERGVFWTLRDAQPGQTITLVSSAGRVYEYQVDWAKTFKEESPDGLETLRSRVGGTTITLVTCTGRYDLQSQSYLDRHIVRATLTARRGPETTHDAR
jgi:LPXTG-site transpeptidase (sortase) family protein